MKKEVDYSQKQQFFFSPLRYFIKYSFTEIKRRNCMYTLALLSVAIIVCAACITQTLIENSQLIMLQSAEMMEGEIDMIISPSFTPLKDPFYSPAQSRTLNFTRVSDLLSKEELSEHISPRNTFEVFSISIKSKIDIPGQDPIIQDRYPPRNTKRQKVIFIESDLEYQIGVGRAHLFGEIPEGQIIINSYIATQLRAKEGDIIQLQIDVKTQLFFLIDGFCSQNGGYFQAKCDSALQFLKQMHQTNSLELRVFKIVDQLTGKESSIMLQNQQYLFMERKHLLKVVFESSKMEYGQNLEILNLNQFSEFSKNTNPNSFADEVIANNIYLFYFLGVIPLMLYFVQIVLNFPQREQIYLNKSFENMQKKAQQLGKRVGQTLGFRAVSIKQPIMQVFYKQEFISTFMQTLMRLVILLFSILSGIMIKSMLLVSVETKTYEFGVLRILGLNKQGVVLLVLTQTLSFLIPGYFIGIALKTIALYFGLNILESTARLHFNSSLSIDSILLSIFLGVIIPLITSIHPIRIALRKQLSLITTKDKAANETVKISVIKIGSVVDFGKFSLGILCLTFGFLVYYLLPVALLRLDFALMMNVFFVIIFGLLIGLITVAINFSFIVEKLVLQILFFWMSAALRAIVRKNLVAHRIKNTRIATVYALSTAFMIFIYSGLTLQLDSQLFLEYKKNGAELAINGLNPDKEVEEYEDFLSQAVPKEIKSFTFSANNFSVLRDNQYVNPVSNIVNRGGMVSLPAKLIGVQQNYLKTAKSDFVYVEQRSRSGLDIVEELYASNSNKIKVILMKSQADLLFATENELNLEDSSDNNDLYLELNSQESSSAPSFIRVHVSAIVSSFPGIGNTEISSPQIIVSLPTLKYFDPSRQSESQFLDKLLIHADLDKVETIKRELIFFKIVIKINGSLWTIQDSQKDREKNEKLIKLIFSGLSLVVMSICFFSLVSLMTSNIFSSAREIAILRAVGTSKTRVCSVYIVESFVVIISSCLIGVFAGIILSYSFSMQRQLFTQMVIRFTFPWFIFIILTGASIFSAFASTLTPIHALLKNSISNIARNAE